MEYGHVDQIHIGVCVAHVNFMFFLALGHQRSCGFSPGGATSYQVYPDVCVED